MIDGTEKPKNSFKVAKGVVQDNKFCNKQNKQKQQEILFAL